jgi:hypothetical protein
MTKHPDRGQAADQFRSAVDRAIDDAIKGHVDRRSIADMLEGAAERQRIAFANTAPIR